MADLPNEGERSSSRPQFDLSGAAIRGNLEDKDLTIVLPNQFGDISHLAIDIGGSLIKLVYFVRDKNYSLHYQSPKGRLEDPNIDRMLGGALHFVTFETGKFSECLDFIYTKQLHRGGINQRGCYSAAPSLSKDNVIIKATGGGAHKYADDFMKRLEVSLEKEDEMECLVAGAIFLLKAIRDEAFVHVKGKKEFVQINQNDLFPYLLVNIGSGVSMIKVDGETKFKRVSGTSLGGGTYWGLGKLLTGCNSFDELLELSQQGDNKAVDMLVGDIYGMDYSKIGLSKSTTASSFGKATFENKKPEDYRPEDISLSLLLMITYNIALLSYLVAQHFGLKRIFFGGFFIRDNAYTMEAISNAVRYWRNFFCGSNGQAEALFLRHEGFLGALGAFMSYKKHGLDDLMAEHVEKITMGELYLAENTHGPLLEDSRPEANTLSCLNIEISQIASEMAKVFLSEGNRSFVAGRYKDAVGFFSEAVHLDPANYIFYLKRSAAYACTNQYEYCLADAKKAAELELATPSDAQVAVIQLDHDKGHRKKSNQPEVENQFVVDDV
ncbi:hypothetical protein GIB67_042711 [Kingdonia uniflora]|uniref:pantothenate kinase n=1 Tax=Kingdonia uniflora TaxID=39325 RepID=A0A7J7NDQ0_9MAGN|nr:hypothetical protein GIB67_042711 [Kingdonia uniflora]